MKITLFCLFFIASMFSLQAEPYLIGAYTQYDLGTNNSESTFSSLRSQLTAGKYNAATLSISTGTSMTSLGNALNGFGDNFKTILHDTMWDLNESNGVGLNSLTFGNFLQLEAEYILEYGSLGIVPDPLTTTLDSGNNNTYNYVCQHDTTNGDRNTGRYSNDYAWICNEIVGNQRCLALSNPRFRWKPTNSIPGITYTKSRSIGYDLKFRHSAVADNKLYLTVAMKFDGYSHAVGDSIATIKLKVLKDIANKYEYADYTNDENNYYEFDLHPVNQFVDTTIFNLDYESVGLVRDYWGNYQFEYYIDFPDTSAMTGLYQNLIVRDGAGDFFVHINPQVIWHGNGIMELDYITVEDELHRQIRLDGVNSPLFVKLQQRLSEIMSVPKSSNILYHSSKDEPFQGQLDMYDLINQKMQDMGLEMFTASHQERHDVSKNNLLNNNADSYRLYGQFLEVAKPDRIAYDGYPLKPNMLGLNTPGSILWNQSAVCADSNFVQNKIDTIVTNPYKFLAEKTHHDPDYQNTELIFITQSFGEWIAGVDTWPFMMPPRSMMKCLQLLPLCYSADGIIDFCIASNPDIVYAGNRYRVTPLQHGIGYSNIQVNPTNSAYQMLTEANSKIAVYGSIISDPLQPLQWKDADCIMINGGTAGVDIGDVLLSDIQVLETENIPYSLPNQYYEGYVQAGYYNDVNQSPSFMMVNRRAVFKTNENLPVLPLNVDEHFYDAASQFIRFRPSASAFPHFGPNEVALYDPYDATIWKMDGPDIDVEIEPGDGRLLEMVGTVPEIVTSNTELRYKACLSGDITISNHDTLSVAENTKLYILPNTRISLNPGSSLNIQGNVSIAENVRFTIYEDASLNILSPDNNTDKTVINAGNLLHIEIASGAVLNLSGILNFKGIVEFCIADSASVNISDAICRFDSLYISGPGNFNIGTECECSFDFQSLTDITGGAVVSLYGIHNYSILSKINVSNLSSLNFTEAVLNMANYIQIVAKNSILMLNSSSIESANPTSGNTISISNISTLSMINSSIKYIPIVISCSNLYVENSEILVKSNTTGVTLSNPYTVVFSNNNVLHGTIGQYNTPLTKGIDIESQAPVIIRNTNFNNLGYGIVKTTATAGHDSIFGCSFEDCTVGISETSSGSIGKIENCSFDDIEDIAINLIGSIPTITSCSFDSCGTGLLFEGSYYSPIESGVYSSSFSFCHTAIESRAANPRVQNCSFNSNDIGLLSHSGSNMNLSRDAYNGFNNLASNIEFSGDTVYKSYIQLLTGHNDFYHGENNTFDFTFDAEYNSSTGEAIDASKNWFVCDSVYINDDDYIDYVVVTDFDPEPNTLGMEPDGSNRYTTALYKEGIGLYEDATAIYSDIIDDQFETEGSYLNGCIDGIFRIKLTQGASLSDLALYFDDKIDQYAEADSSFTKLIKDYLVKTYVASKEFQSAIDLIQPRIDNPVCEIDSLCAVLDLEIVLQLASMEEAKKPITTQYSQYKYPNMQVFRSKHDEHWALLYKLLKGDNAPEVPVPTVPHISTNYPNPFNPSTTLEFSVPKTGKVKLNVYNLRGQKVRELINTEMELGHHRITWDGRDSNNRGVSSGIYFIRLESGGKGNVRKVMLLK